LLAPLDARKIARLPVTTVMALRLAKLTGTTAQSWARMQLAYDLQVSEPAMAEQLAAIPTLQAT
jgi:plasmid maintenance system antidote protein VapI